MNQLIILAHARSQLQGGAPDEYLARFQEHLGTEFACPAGHPEITLAITKAKQGNLIISKSYLCPACSQTPTEFFD